MWVAFSIWVAAGITRFKPRLSIQHMLGLPRPAPGQGSRASPPHVGRCDKPLRPSIAKYALVVLHTLSELSPLPDRSNALGIWQPINADECIQYFRVPDLPYIAALPSIGAQVAK